MDHNWDGVNFSQLVTERFFVIRPETISHRRNDEVPSRAVVPHGGLKLVMFSAFWLYFIVPTKLVSSLGKHAEERDMPGVVSDAQGGLGDIIRPRDGGCDTHSGYPAAGLGGKDSLFDSRFGINAEPEQLRAKLPVLAPI